MISIIIPTYNEVDHIRALLLFLWKQGDDQIAEIIVSDGGSTDHTFKLAKEQGAQVVLSPKKGRAAQMNYGALMATGSILYFLHADTFPPKEFSHHILKAINDRYESGCFRLQFDYQHWFLKVNCWFTRFDINNFRFGDQSLFVTKQAFQKAGGFKEELIVLEDQEIITRIKKHTKFKIVPASVTTSARKYMLNGIYKTQAVYFLIYLMYKMGYAQQKLLSTYCLLMRQDKL